MQQLAIQILFFLRFVQLGTTVIAGFIACDLVWWHIQLNDKVPQGLTVFICTSIFTFLECYVSSAVDIYKRATQPSYSCLPKAAGAAALLSAIGYRALRQVPFVQRWCEGNNFASKYENIEKSHCALVCDMVVTGALQVIFSCLITLFATACSALEKKKDVNAGLEDLLPDYSDLIIAGGVKDEKK